MTVGQRIRAAIDAKGVKDVWVADGAGISKTTLSNIINGVTRDPSSSVLAAIADVLGESVDAFLGRAGHPLLTHEQDTLRTAASIITERVLPLPNEQRVATTSLPRRRPKRANRTVIAPSIAATPNREIFTDVRELRRRYDDYECVKRLRLLPDGSVALVSENPKYDDVLLTPEQRNALEVYGIVVQRLTVV